MTRRLGACRCRADGLVGLDTETASARLQSAGSRNVEFINREDGNVTVPSTIFRVVSAPTPGTLANPNLALVISVGQPPPAESYEQAQRDNAIAEAKWRRQQTRRRRPQ